MSRNTLVINCDLRETRVCLIEDGVIAELHLERSQHRGSVGNIVLGRVTRVLPGMQAAFIDIGMERAAFLHVEDLIRPDDFEAYLDKGDRREDEPSGKGDGSRRFPGRAEGEDADDDQDAQTIWDEEPDSDRAKPARKGDSEEPERDTEPDSTTVDDSNQRPLTAAEARRTILDEVGAEKSLPAALDRVSNRPEPEEIQCANVDEDDIDELGSEEDLGEEDLSDEDSEVVDSNAEGDEDQDELDEADEDPIENGELDETDETDEDPIENGELDEADEEEESDDAKPLEAAASGGDSDAPDVTEAAEDRPLDAKLGLDDDTDVTEVTASLPSMLGYEELPAAEATRSEALPPQAAASAQREGRGRRRRRRRKRNGVEDSQPSVQQTQPEPAKRQERPVVDARQRGPATRESTGDSGRNARRQDPRARGREASRDRRAGGKSLALARVSRSVPITEIVKEGDEVVVQISKEPIGTKGARVTSHVSLPGRHVVYLPTVDHVGISKRIGSPKERNRLRQVIEALKPDSGGLIVRTVAEGLTKKALKTDIGYLIALWKEVSKKKATVKAPCVLYAELDLVLKTARDLFTDDVQKIIIDDREQYARLVQFVEMFSPTRVKDIELYTGDEPIFDAYGIEDEIGRALGRKVPLPSGGYLVIDQAEALTAIDVNTGRFVGKGSKDLEETALKTNLEAVTEIAYQLRLRNIGGLVILDLIDMDHASNRDKVWRSLEQHLAKDKAKTTINRISDLGLIEMTRKRTRESLTRMLHEPCFYCDGTGQIQSRATVAYEILRQVRRERHLLKGYSIVVNAHPAVIDLLQTDEKAAVQEAERRYMRRLELVPRREYHLEQFDLQGR